MIDIETIRAARERIRFDVRETPVIRVAPTLSPATEADLVLKLECLQATGSFKARGAANRLLTLEPARLANGIVAASGGNHGLATARAAKLANVPARIFLPANASPAKVAQIRRFGAEAIVVGSHWDEAQAEAEADAKARGSFCFHPFADPAIVAGQGTVALELLEQVGPADLYVIAVGGGGLIAGMASVIRQTRPKARIVGVEPTGSPTLKASLDAGRVVRLDRVTTRVATMACGRTDEAIFAIVRDAVDEIVLVEDEALLDASRWLWTELGIAADLSGAASVAALRTGAVKAKAGERVIGLVCGAGPDGIETR